MSEGKLEKDQIVDGEYILDRDEYVALMAILGSEDFANLDLSELALKDEVVNLTAAQNITGSKSFTKPIAAADPAQSNHVVTRQFLETAMTAARTLRRSGTFGTSSSTTGGDVPAAPKDGEIYKCVVDSDTAFSSNRAGTVFYTGDLAIRIDGSWSRVPNKVVDSINGQRGALNLSTDFLLNMDILAPADDTKLMQVYMKNVDGHSRPGLRTLDLTSVFNPPDYVNVTNAQTITGVKTFTHGAKTNVSPASSTDIVNLEYLNNRLGALNSYVTLSTAQTISGAKQFTGITRVPTPSSSDQAANKSYVDGKYNESVHLSGNQTVNGVKTFKASPVVPAPSAPEHAVNKQYVDSSSAAGVDLTSNQTINGVKTFNDSPVVPTPSNSNQASNKHYVDGKYNNSVHTSGNQSISGTKTFTGALRTNHDPQDSTDVMTKNSMSAYVDRAHAQTISGTKTFNDSPRVPAPSNNDDATPKQYVDAVRDGVVLVSGNQSIGGTKTFTDRCIVPTPTSPGDDAANATYVESQINTCVHLEGDQTIKGVKTFNNSPVVPAPSADGHAATKKYVDENSVLTDAEVDAIQAANSPSAGNPIATMNDISQSEGTLDGTTWVSGVISVSGTHSYTVDHPLGTSVASWQVQVRLSSDDPWLIRWEHVEDGGTKLDGAHIYDITDTYVKFQTGGSYYNYTEARVIATQGGNVGASISVVDTFSNAPNDADDGDLIYVQDEQTVYVYDNNAWVDVTAASGGADSVNEVGYRDSDGEWTISGLSIGKPLYIIGQYIGEASNAQFSVGSVSGVQYPDGAEESAYRTYLIGRNDEYVSGNTTIFIPTETTVVLEVYANNSDYMVARAYQ